MSEETQPMKKALIPHEHIIIPFDDMHPVLQLHAMTIHMLRKNELAVTLGSLILSSLITASERIFLGHCSLLTFGTSHALIQGGLIPHISIINVMEADDRFFVIENGQGQNYFPSTISRRQTYNTSQTFKNILNNNEYPFEHLNVSGILSTYNVGLFDKDMNLVLIKDPLSKWNQKPKTGIKLLARRALWHWKWLPKRPRFEISPLEVKEKQEAPVNASSVIL